MSSTTPIENGQDASDAEIVPWSEKVWRKSKEEPLVPIGVLATAGALTMAILSFRKRQRWHMQYWMRARVVAQGLTVGVMIMYYYRTKPNEVEKTRHLDEVSIKREERESKDRQEFLTRLKNAEDQWKEDQRPTAKEGDVKSEIPEADRAKSLKAGLPTNSGGGWWKMSWLWGSASKN